MPSTTPTQGRSGRQSDRRRDDRDRNRDTGRENRRRDIKDRDRVRKPKEKKPAPGAGQAMIIVTVNDRLGTKTQVPALPSDPIRVLTTMVAAKIGRPVHEIMLMRQGERPFHDQLTLEDYAISIGVRLDLELTTGDGWIVWEYGCAAPRDDSLSDADQRKTPISSPPQASTITSITPSDNPAVGHNLRALRLRFKSDQW